LISAENETFQLYSQRPSIKYWPTRECTKISN
jgi:hypothetical protein